MWYLKLPRIKMHWQRRSWVNTIANYMPRNRYFTIRNNIKCVEDELVTDDEKKCDKFWKVRPVAVSYTHLDVYKRQPIAILIKNM